MPSCCKTAFNEIQGGFYRHESVLKAEITQITAWSLAGPIFTQSEHSCYMNLCSETIASIRYLKIQDIVQWSITHEMLDLRCFQKLTQNFTLNADTDFKPLLHTAIFNAFFFTIVISPVNIDFLILSSCSSFFIFDILTNPPKLSTILYTLENIVAYQRGRVTLFNILP